MAKTQAERAKEYRQKKRDVRDKMRDAVTAKCDENVTESKRDAPFVTEAGPPCVETVPESSESTAAPSVDRPKPTFKDLPPDVQAEIEKHCSENNDGARSASHSRQAMTERALRYHKEFGGRPKPSGVCLTCGGPVHHPKVVKCLKCCMENR